MKTIFFFFLCSLALRSVAQNGHQNIQGAFADSLTSRGIPFATVGLYQNKKFITSVPTDSLGRFIVRNLAEGSYVIRFSQVGYRRLQTGPWQLKNRDTLADIGTIKVGQLATELQTVTIRGRRALVEQRLDGITFNAEKLPKIAGSDAADVLRQVPMIAMDQNNGLLIRGSSNVKILIDGRPSEQYAPNAADALKMIRGENIVRVEVITNPSAKYDAEGTDAVVNIITRKLRENQINGHLSLMGGNRNDNIMGDLHVKTGKWLVNSDAFYQWNWSRNGYVLERSAAGVELQQKNESSQLGRYFSGGVNITYSIDSLNTLNLGYHARPSNDHTDSHTDNFNGLNGAFTPSFQSDTYLFNTNTGTNWTAAYTGVAKDGSREFSINSSYSLSGNNGGYNLELNDNAVGNRENMSSTSNNHDFMIQADYSKSFNKKWKWEAGGKLSGRNAQSVSLVDLYDFQTGHFIRNDLRSNSFSYRSDIYAAYSNLSLQLSNWGFSTGLRFERTDLNAVFKTVSLRVPSFTNFAPQVLLSRTLGDQSSLKLSYSLKISRPNIAYLNPTVSRSDSLNIRTGNPYLKPELINRFQLSYTINDPVLFKDIAVFFNDNHNTIESISNVLPGGVFQNTWGNTGKNRRLGLVLTANWKPTADFIFGATYTGQQVWYNSPALGINHNGLMHQLVINSSYKLPKGYSLNLYGFFSSKSLTLQGYREGWKYYSMSFSKATANERLNVSLRLDAFLTPYAYIDEEISTGSYRQLQTTRYQNQNVRFIIAYRFGKDIKAPRLRSADEN